MAEPLSLRPPFPRFSRPHYLRVLNTAIRTVRSSGTERVHGADGVGVINCIWSVFSTTTHVVVTVAATYNNNSNNTFSSSVGSPVDSPRTRNDFSRVGSRTPPPRAQPHRTRRLARVATRPAGVFAASSRARVPVSDDNPHATAVPRL